MVARFYTFKKRLNSTKLVDTEGTEVNFVYKQNSDSNYPSIQLSHWNTNWNYAKIDNHYYFVDSVQYMANNLFVVTLSIDLLASYRTDILSTVAYVTRASSIYNENIVDDLNTHLTTVDEKIKVETPKVGESLLYETGEGCYILHTINALTGTVHGAFTIAYILTSEQMRQIAHILTTTDQNIIEQIAIAFNKPIDSIFKVVWLPLSIDIVAVQTGSLATPVYLGSYDTGISAYCIGDNLVTCRCEFTLNDVRPKGYFKNPKLTNLALTIPFTGTVGIDSKRIFENENSGNLIVDIAIDAREGRQISIVRTSEHQTAPVNVFETVIGYPCKVGAASIDILGGINNSMQALALASTGNPLFGMSSVMNGMVDFCIPSCTAIGTNGGNMAEIAIGGNITLTIITRNTQYELNNDLVRQTLGLPFNDIMLLADIESGYVKCINASVETNAHKQEIDTINNYLNGGIYIE